MNLKNVVLGIAIIILTISVVGYGISVFYDRPDYNDFCPDVWTQQIIESEQECVAIGGQWNAYDGSKPVVEVREGYCDREYTCRKEHQNALKSYSRNLFVITLILGIAFLALGGFFFSLEAVGAGLMGGGVGVILYGVGAYWRYSGDVLRFVLSFLGLAAVIYLAYWMNKKPKKSKK